MTNRSIIVRALEDAADSLPVRRRYARDVLLGYQYWSGSDLQGKARRYGGGYARQRMHAAEALFNVGGRLEYVGRYGRLVAVISVGSDDYGNELVQTLAGAAVATAKRNFSLIKVK